MLHDFEDSRLFALKAAGHAVKAAKQMPIFPIFAAAEFFAAFFQLMAEAF